MPQTAKLPAAFCSIDLPETQTQVGAALVPEQLTVFRGVCLRTLGKGQDHLHTSVILPYLCGGDKAVGARQRPGREVGRQDIGLDILAVPGMFCWVLISNGFTAGEGGVVESQGQGVGNFVKGGVRQRNGACGGKEFADVGLGGAEHCFQPADTDSEVHQGRGTVGRPKMRPSLTGAQ